MLSESRRVKVLDLGLATLLEPEAKDGFQTDAGIAVGSMEYISPEQACHKRVDGRCDIYSLGCVMYHLISGRLPFAGDSSMERLAVRITGHCVPIKKVVPGLHPGVVHALEKMMARRPEDRFQSAGEVAEALRHLVRRKAAPAPTVSPSSTPTVLPTVLTSTSSRADLDRKCLGLSRHRLALVRPRGVIDISQPRRGLEPHRRTHRPGDDQGVAVAQFGVDSRPRRCSARAGLPPTGARGDPFSRKRGGRCFLRSTRPYEDNGKTSTNLS